MFVYEFLEDIKEADNRVGADGWGDGFFVSLYVCEVW
jgi:hypothetical protein